MIRLLQRICWNTRGWMMPTGNSTDGGYPSDTGFGHEEWNFQLEDAFDDYVYGYLYFTPANKTIEHSQGIFDIGFWTIHPDTRQRLLVGFYHEATIAPADIFAELYNNFESSGIIQRRAEELVQAVPTFSITQALQEIKRSVRSGIYKFRCPISQVELFEQYRPLSIEINGKRIGSYFARPTFVTSFNTIRVIPQRTYRPSEGRQTPLAEDAYYRENARNLRVIIPRHNQLSNAFCGWLRGRGIQHPVQERNQVDVSFETETATYLAELKVCYGVGATKAIREALGQLLEYNFYGNRSPANRWLIVLDEPPTTDDINYINRLKDQFSFPVTLGWCDQNEFRFVYENAIY